MNLYWYSQDDIINQIKSERALSESVFEEKREILRRRIKLINWQSKPQEKVNINTAAAQINTYIALSYADELKVSFSARSIADDEVAVNKTYLAEFDFDEMGLDELNYQKQFDKWFAGLSIRTFEPFDKVRNVPVVKLQDPLSWYADPYPTGFSAQDFRWHWFEYEVTFWELERAWGFHNLSEIGKQTAENANQNQVEYKDAAWMSATPDTTPNKVKLAIIISDECGVEILRIDLWCWF